MAKKKQKAFNPVEYKTEFMELASQRPDEAADVAIEWRARYMNQSDMMALNSQNLAHTATLFGAGMGAGFFDGRAEATRAALIRHWEDEGHLDVDGEGTSVSLEDYPMPWDHPNGEKDPKNGPFGYVPKTLGATIVIGVAAVAANYFNRDTAAEYLMTAAKGTGTVFAADVARGWGRRMKEESLKKASDETTDE